MKFFITEFEEKDGNMTCLVFRATGSDPEKNRKLVKEHILEVREEFKKYYKILGVKNDWTQGWVEFKDTWDYWYRCYLSDPDAIEYCKVVMASLLTAIGDTINETVQKEILAADLL